MIKSDSYLEEKSRVQFPIIQDSSSQTPLRMSLKQLNDKTFVNLHPNGKLDNWRGYNGNNVQLRIFLKGKMQDIDLTRVHTEKCLDCIVPDYNPRITKHLCSDPIQCAAVYPDITDNVKMGYKPGERTRKVYPQLEDNFLA